MAVILGYYTEFGSFGGQHYLIAVEDNPILSAKNVAKDILFQQCMVYSDSQKLLRKSALTKGTSLGSEYSTCKVR